MSVPLPMCFSIFLEGKGCRSSLSQGQLPCRDFLQMLPLEVHLGPGTFPERWVLCLEGAGWAVGDEVRPEMRPHGSEEQMPRFPGVISFPSPPPPRPCCPLRNHERSRLLSLLDPWTLDPKGASLGNVFVVDGFPFVDQAQQLQESSSPPTETPNPQRGLQLPLPVAPS